MHTPGNTKQAEYLHIYLVMEQMDVQETLPSNSQLCKMQNGVKLGTMKQNTYHMERYTILVSIMIGEGI